ncbi:MAG: hypothetical protein HWD61_05030 [Parachlamydiaceae bacterium]|nr:MAG: hypothetical protein HWD61_05030 [Parachlamydiaceae bacterium]
MSYAGFLRRLIEKIKGLFCGVNQMQREIVVYRLLNFLELGASKGWLDKKEPLTPLGNLYTIRMARKMQKSKL